jgi:chemotaxis protein methyltransferase CheR
MPRDEAGRRDTRPVSRVRGYEAARPPIGHDPAAVLPVAPPLPLAHGDLSERETAELLALKEQIESAAGFQCRGYKEKCLRRRIAVRMRACGVHGYADYAALLRSDSAEYARLVDTLTINVSKFYRNPDVWDTIRTVVLPALYATGAPELRVWSAGTASGEEAYTMKMLAVDHARESGLDDDRMHILGTDIDRDSLAQAARARYTDFAMTDIDPAVRDRWFTHDGVHHLRDEARRNVQFATLDLIRDPCPQGQHLILCRSVIIYFERSLQEQLFRRFHEALVPGGYLVLGKVEALFGAAAGLFQSVSNRQRVFRRT